VNLSRHLYLVFALGVLLPGLLLAYLSVRTVKDEGLLVEKSLEGANLAFAEALDRHVERAFRTQFERAQSHLRLWTTSKSPDSLAFLASGLLEVPIIQSLVVVRNGKQVLPPPNLVAAASTEDRAEAQPIQAAPEGELSPRAQETMAAIRLAYKQGRDDEAVRGIRYLLGLPDSALQSAGGLDMRFGFRLLELKCLARANRIDEAALRVRSYVVDLLGEPADMTPQRRVFYLDEAIGTVTSLENLSPEMRDWLFRLHQRLGRYLANAEYVADHWPDPIREAYSLPPDDTAGLSIGYADGRSYWVVGYPWLDQETRIVARLNESVLVEAIQNDFLASNKAVTREIEFRIVDFRDRTVFASDTLPDRAVALERPVGKQFPRWRLLVFKKQDSEMTALGRRRTALQWLLLLFSFGGLIMGSAAVVVAVRHERRNVRIKTNFLSAVSHELKTPLTAIRMFSELLESGRQKEEEKRIRYARLIGEEARRLQGMIEGILSLGRMEEGKARLQFDTVKPAEVVREVAALMAGAFTKAEITLVVHVDESLLLNADRDALRSVVQNLLENALKYSEGGTEVTLKLERVPQGVALSVKDQGIGIAKEDQHRIFETFWRAGDEMTRRTRGSGLGLAIVKQIADAHKARIEVQSQPGQGTLMTLIFPYEGMGDA
jgi:signal transduction histidine kinase